MTGTASKAVTQQIAAKLKNEVELRRRGCIDPRLDHYSRADLAAADIEYRDGTGRMCDFHALRHTFITNVVRSGAGVKTCQTLARHKDPRLTFAVYSHLQISDVAGALANLPAVTGGQSAQRICSAQTRQRAS